MNNSLRSLYALLATLFLLTSCSDEKLMISRDMCNLHIESAVRSEKITNYSLYREIDRIRSEEVRPTRLAKLEGCRGLRNSLAKLNEKLSESSWDLCENLYGFELVTDYPAKRGAK